MDYLPGQLRDVVLGVSIVGLVVAALRSIPVLSRRPTLAVALSMPVAVFGAMFMFEWASSAERRVFFSVIVGAAVVLLWLKRRA